MTLKRFLTLLIAMPLVLLSCSEDTTRPPTTGGGSTAGEDVTPPAAVVDLAVAYDTLSGPAVLTWTAPSDPGDVPRVSRYDIRYSYSLPIDLDLAIKVLDPPEPGVPGVVDRYEIVDPLRGRDLYAVIRSYDAAGNPSPVSGIVHQYIGGHEFSVRCIDALSGVTLPGLNVVVTARKVHEGITDVAGRFLLPDIAGGAVNVSIRGTGPTVFHWIDHGFEITDDVSVLYKMIEYRPTDLVYESAFRTLLAAINFQATGPVFKKWRTVPVPVYIPEYTNALGTKYDSLAVAAVEHWEARTGVDLFVLVDSIPDVGVDFRYLSPANMTGNARTIRTNDSTGYPFRDTVQIVNIYSPDSNLFLAILHELGHTIRLEHLPDRRYIMYASTLPPEISDDEVLAVQLHAALPNSINLSIYDPSAPPSQ